MKRPAIQPRPLRWWQRPAVRFGGGFLGLMIVYSFVAAVPWVQRHLVEPVLGLSAHGASALLNVAGANTTAQGATIVGDGFSVRVRRGCDPLEPIALFAAAVLAFPASIGRKLPALAAGASVLFGANVLRIASLYLAGKQHPGWFQTLHEEWWPGALIVAALILWMAWLRWVRTSPQSAHG